MADSRQRWDTDDRFTGVADASAFAPAVEELSAQVAVALSGSALAWSLTTLARGFGRRPGPQAGWRA